MVLTRSQTKLMEANMLEVVIDFDYASLCWNANKKRLVWEAINIYVGICSKMENAVIGRLIVVFTNSLVHRIH